MITNKTNQDEGDNKVIKDEILHNYFDVTSETMNSSSKGDHDMYNFLLQHVFINKYNIRFQDPKYLIKYPKIQDYKIIQTFDYFDNSINPPINANTLMVFVHPHDGHTGNIEEYKSIGYDVRINANENDICYPKKYLSSKNEFCIDEIIACIKHACHLVEAEGTRNNNPESYYDTYGGKNDKLTIYFSSTANSIGLDRYLDSFKICTSQSTDDESLYIFYKDYS